MAGSFSVSMAKMWDDWQIRVVVLLSLLLQIVLIIFGNKRKYTVSTWIGVLIWIAYLSADSVATVSLSILSIKAKTNSIMGSITPFWAPFLIMHLGGPDTITAYSLEDNELWLRHLLQLIVQVGVAFYVFMRSWSSRPLTFLAIPVLIPGIIKYGERIWVLWSASFKHFRDSLLPAPEAGPDYTAFTEEYSRRIAQGLDTTYSGLIEVAKTTVLPISDRMSSDAKLLQQAYFLFSIFKRLYADLILDFNQGNDGSSLLGNKTPKDAFKLIEIELGIMYDTLFNKTSFAHSRVGIAIRCISFLSISSALIAFSVIVEKNMYSIVDVTITYLLLVGGALIEIYAGTMLVLSERTLHRLISTDQKWMVTSIYRVISSTPWASINRQRWSCSMSQYNLIGFCLKDKPSMFEGIQKLIRVHEVLEKIRYRTREKVTADLKEIIFQQINQKCMGEKTREVIKKSRLDRGDYVLKRRSCWEKFKSSVDEVEFDQSILLWHIATNLCYYTCQEAVPSLKCKISKKLSDYMLYLLVMQPLMLPKGIGEIRYKDTCAETIRFTQQKKKSNIPMTRGELCRLLLLVNTDLSPDMVKGDRSKSVLFKGCMLAKSLQELVENDLWENEEKWDLMMEVWVEMLCYAANHCSWNQHAQRLAQGGELLSHVCLLMAHLGISEQFQISAGNAEYKFNTIS